MLRIFCLSKRRDFPDFLREKQRVRVVDQVCANTPHLFALGFRKQPHLPASVVNHPQSCELGHKSRYGHHKPSAKILSLHLNNPVGPQAWRGFHFFLRTWCPSTAPVFSGFCSLSPFLLYFVRTSRVKSPQDDSHINQRVTEFLGQGILLSIGRIARNSIKPRLFKSARLAM